MKKYFVWIYLLAVTVLVQPWRNFFCQDDGAYAYSAINWSHGAFQNHAANLSFLLPQISLGALFVKVFSFVEPARVLNSLTWVLFCILTLIFSRLLKKSGQSVLLLSFFSFPVWWQYGASYLVEIYSSLFVVGYLFCCDHLKMSNQRSFWVYGLGVFVFSFLLGSQIQSLVALPLFLSTFYFWKGSRSTAALSFAGAILSTAVYFNFPHTPYQEGYGYWVVQNWIRFNFYELVTRYLFQVTQALLALGLFFVALVRFSNRKNLDIKNLKEGFAIIGLQTLFVVVGYAEGFDVMSGGVLFFDHLPAWIGHLFLSFGFWGLGELYVILKSIKYQKADGWLFCFLALLIGFSAFRFANDIRVMMAGVTALLYFLITRNAFDKTDVLSYRLGQSRLIFCILFLVSLFLNLYNLNTNEARWNVAKSYEAKGISQSLISAGVGYDLFYLENDCVLNLVKQLRRETEPSGSPYWKNPRFHREIIAQVNRSYSDNWIPQIEIKPSTAFGFNLNSKGGNANASKSPPIHEDLVSYSVLGIEQTLRVLEFDHARPGRCMTASKF